MGIHGVFIVVEKALTKFRMTIFKQYKALNYLIAIPFTFVIVCFAWIFFRANNFNDAILIINNSLAFPGFSLDNILTNEFDRREYWVLIVAIVILLIKDFIDRNDMWIEKLNNKSFILRWLVYLIIILSIIFYGQYGDDTPAEFIYFQF